MRSKESPRWAVTGPTGAGKSLLCAMLTARGAQLIEADRVAHELLDQPMLQERLVKEFGNQILDSDGRIDRQVLGRIVFQDSAARARLDSLVHPPLAEALSERIEEAGSGRSPLVILEAAVYFLLPGPPPVDWTLAVLASVEVRLARLIAKGMDRTMALARVAAQTHLEPTWVRADRVITNDGSRANLTAVAAKLWRNRIAPNAQDGCT